MKFGREFGNHLEKTLPGWRDEYLRYKLLKKLLNNISPAAGVLPLPEFQVWFVAVLAGEIEKFNDFYVGKEEDLIIRFQALKEAIKRVKSRERYYEMFTSESEFSEYLTRIRKDLVVIHGEMVLLISYSSLNFAGNEAAPYHLFPRVKFKLFFTIRDIFKLLCINHILVGIIKILKKYDKRTGAMLSIPFTQLAFHQPFFKTEPLTRLVHDCEANLEVLLPRRAEEHTGTNASLETLLLVEDTGDVYRSTIATISTIEELKKKPSSTYNSLSMSYLFRSKDEDGSGAVTAENSPCNSSQSSAYADEHEDEDEDVSSHQ
ncbi:SPX domain-containing protein 4-like isoform X1 [Salvia miltiorrhiza]|uniref:SPX domain-containing protein 4-like isoform X1 n=1 Tax=Salvia miltiorrhiza TaxID=226208 RepID=UPI0025AB820B|nr:SPX domain-containing protein 4-like isoform X1 [Salvia miltiorrhiza]